MKSLYIDKIPSKTRLAVMENGELAEFYIENENYSSVVGNIYCGVVSNVANGIGAAFVKIGREKNGFLHMDETLIEKEDADYSKISKKRILVGDKIMVQITKEEEKAKGARITSNISLVGRYLIYTPLVNYIGISKKIVDENKREQLRQQVATLADAKSGFVVRTAAEKVDFCEIEEDARKLILLYQDIKEKFDRTDCPSLIYSEHNLLNRTIRDFVVDDIDNFIVSEELYPQFIIAAKQYKYNKQKIICYKGKRDMFMHFGIDLQIDKLLSKKIELKSGGFLHIDRGEALTTIDVNSGKYFGEGNIEETVLSINLEAATEIARQIRLRNIGGIIICDFVDMLSLEHRQIVLERLSTEVAKDRIRTRVLGMTSLCLVEIVRQKKIRDNDSLLMDDCPFCKGVGKIPSVDYIIMKMRSTILDLFLDSKATGVILTTSAYLSNALFSSNAVSEDVQKNFNTKRIYIHIDENFKQYEYRFQLCKTSIITVPNNAKLLY